MKISTIKERLPLSEILDHYGLKPKNNMLKCYWHDDKTASLQVNLEKNFYKCHACGKTGDAIQFIEDYEKISKHEAINKAKGFLLNSEAQSQYSVDRGTAKTGQTNPSGEKSVLFLKDNQNNIDVAGGTAKWQAEFLGKMLAYFKNALNSSKPARDYLEKRGLDNAVLEIGYNSGQFHHGERKTEELLKRSLEAGLLLDKGFINNRTKEKAYYVFANKCLIFPLRNKENEIVSIYGRSILDNDKGKHFYLKNRCGIYPNYPNPETKKLILTEAIIDCASLLQIKKIKDNYSLLSCFGANGLNEEILEIIKSLKDLEEIIFCFDQDKAGKEAVEKYSKHLKEHLPSKQISTVELPCKDVNETLQLHNEDIFTELLDNRTFIFSDEVESLDTQLNDKHAVILTKEESLKTNNDQPKTVTDFLSQKDLLKNLNQLIEKAGIIGEENSRLLLFLITISYLNKNPLHGIVQGSSGSGKTHIISRIADMMPQEDVLRFTRITESSLYNWGEFDLFQKIIIIEDLDGLKEDALYALREFISNQVLRSSVTIKDKKGNNKSSHKIVKGQFSSLSATTKGETYEDNMNRSFIVAVNESDEQTEKIISYQNRRNAGEIDRNEQEKAINFIQKIVRNLKHYEVINPYATQIQLPNNVKNKRRLNEMFQAIIKQITIVYQYQREIKNGFLVTEIEDIENAVEILFESIILKIDELDGSLRQFFEKLKKSFKEEQFSRFDAMEVTGFKKTQLQFYLNDLVRLEYLKQIGFANKGFKYKISYNDNIQRVRKDLKEAFTKQLEELKKNKK
ncbi:CHC2 zinc finger domain-containing protein [Chryseobacterium oryctis]|uniref:CHC2 zinc finger domain-containing protein n=1 Tax=Chryseobacterium oryctis TaxID=2952618 RepID=A0ABT3HSV0_9FLAO|nr:CHC2 zinc finger domain-containing protein [Chryseobacterium oryctis]MCW3162854.1 CHC2 zinc finger domain-containing protein [Chryseobacterium oryctis]MCW3162860.1 CHC2 zinc finger domain-containing protein [Chryseobacterium oryctis]